VAAARSSCRLPAVTAFSTALPPASNICSGSIKAPMGAFYALKTS
jgi:hypothetical protein